MSRQSKRARFYARQRRLRRKRALILRVSDLMWCEHVHWRGPEYVDITRLTDSARVYLRVR